MNIISIHELNSVLESKPILIVGAGLFGITIARSISDEFPDKKILILESRNHIGGNAYSFFDEETQIEVHKYGTHIFHTEQPDIWNYVNQFTEFNSYIHKVKAKSKNRLYTLPFNLQTFSEVYGRFISPTEMSEIIKTFKNKIEPRNFEEKAVSLVGPEIYEILIKQYTEKQWQIPARDLPEETISRLPVRLNYDDRYFSDKYQGLPLLGYNQWFLNMLNAKNIIVALNCDYFELNKNLTNDLITIYSGPIDRFFEYKAGKLNWRTLDFEIEKLPVSDFQANSVINYCDKTVEFTRVHEFKHLHPERPPREKTIIAREYSRPATKMFEEFYPVNSSNDRKIISEYRKLSNFEKNIWFGGRLGSYKYLDMHAAIASARTLYRNELRNKIR